MNVYNVTGADYSELVDYVDNGHPVLVWGNNVDGKATYSS